MLLSLFAPRAGKFALTGLDEGADLFLSGYRDGHSATDRH